MAKPTQPPSKGKATDATLVDLGGSYKLDLSKAGAYTIKYDEYSGQITMSLDGAKRSNPLVFSNAQWEKISDWDSADLGNSTFNFVGNTIYSADVEYSLAELLNMDKFMAVFLTANAGPTDPSLTQAQQYQLTYGTAIENSINDLSFDGAKAGTFAMIWDYLDERGGYYNDETNTQQFFLTIEYTEWLNAGNTPITNLVAKWTRDGADEGIVADRSQTLHDNIMGNWHLASLQDKLLPAGLGGSNQEAVTGLYQQLYWESQSRGLDVWFDRPYYGGNENEDATPTRTFEDALNDGWALFA